MKKVKVPISPELEKAVRKELQKSHLTKDLKSIPDELVREVCKDYILSSVYGDGLYYVQDMVGSYIDSSCDEVEDTIMHFLETHSEI